MRSVCWSQYIPPPSEVLIGAGPACCTCVRMLAAPPAAAMTYVKPSSGLEPSVYGGGGSPSSRSLLDCPSLVSRGSAALVSATTVDDGAACCSSVSWNGNGGAGPAGAVAVRDAVAQAVVRGYGSSGEGAGKYWAGKPSEEKGGGLSAAEAVEGSWSRSRSCCSCGRSCSAGAGAASRRKCESTSTLKRGARPRREGVGVLWIESSSEATVGVV